MTPDEPEEPEELEDPFEFEEVDDDDDEDEGHPEPEVTIEISGLSLYTHMGVSEAEREIGQRLLVDVRMDAGAVDATITDRIEDTVDYGEVCQVVNLLIEQYELHAVWVKAAKPEPPIALPVSEVAVEVWREA